MALENPLYKQIPIGKILTVGSVTLIIAFASIAVAIYSQYRGSAQDSRKALMAVEVQNLVTQIESKLTHLLEPNNRDTINGLASDIRSMDERLEGLSAAPAGIMSKWIPRAPETERGLANIQEYWGLAEKDLSSLLAKREALEKISQAHGAVFLNRGSGRELFQLAHEAAELAIRQNESPAMVQAALQLDNLAFRTSRNIRTVLSISAEKAQPISQLQEEILTFRSLTNRLLRGDNTSPGGVVNAEVRNKVTEVVAAAEPFRESIETIVAQIGSLNELSGVAGTVQNQLRGISDEAASLAQIFSRPTIDKRVIILIACLTLFILAMLFFMVASVLKDLRGRERATAFEGRRNQEAILKLLEETTPMGEGDLTVRASVDEAITGAIADALNFMLEEMSAVIRRINSTADQVTQETETVQDVSERLYIASQKQSQEIETTANTVLQVTQSIGEVAEAAGQSANVAQQSLDAAGKGATAVRSQIDSMSEIRSQIQETAKRIKRLGDSSLEIGEIVSLISDITDQTNVLALNAAIQAASAGEAGRGFAVVAEEVQRLAERSAEATKQISAIVKTIQSDTQDAISAMERSTSGVVEGTRLSEEAGDALADIERVSNRLAELIRNISQLTHAQAMSVDEVREAIASILKATDVATQGAEQTTTSVNRLTQVAAELRAAVSGFKV